MKRLSSSTGVRCAVVLGTDVNGLGHIRSLGSRGIRVIGVYPEGNSDSLGRYSRFCTPLCVPSEGDFEAALIQRIVSLGNGMGSKPVLFATSDYYVDLISRHREVLASHFLFNIPDENTLYAMTNKEALCRAANRIGLRAPRTLVASSRDDVSAVARSIQYPCLIKPKDSFTVDFPGKSFVATYAAELLKFADAHPQLIDWLLFQEIIPGDESNIYQCTGYFSSKGEPLQLFTMQKIHQFPPGFGITTLGRSVLREDLMEMSVYLLTNLGCTGFASVEFKRHSENGNYYLIEVNPRLPWYNALFTVCQVNLPLLAFEELSCPDRAGRSRARQREDVQWMYLRNELAGCWTRRQSARGDGFLHLLKALPRTRSFAYWCRNDPLPFVMAFLDFLIWLPKVAARYVASRWGV